MHINVQATSTPEVERYLAVVGELERAGADGLWIGEAYGPDAATALGYAAAKSERLQLGAGVFNVFSRTAATIAMTGLGLDRLSGGRAMCGLGTSGPQVVEGLHGMPFDLPLRRLIETTEICRQLWRGEKASLDGRSVAVPRAGRPPMRLLGKPSAPIPVWWASLGPASVTAAAEHADGWLPFLFLPEHWQGPWGTPLAEGLARRNSSLGPLEIAADVVLAIGDEYVGEAALEVLSEHRSLVALHVGGMGPRGANAYNTVVRQYGMEETATLVQDLYLEGKRREAEAAVSDELLLGGALVGPASAVRDRLAVYREAGVTTLNVTVAATDPVLQIAALAELVAA